MSTIYIKTRTILMEFINFGLAHLLINKFTVKNLGKNLNKEFIYQVEFDYVDEELDAYITNYTNKHPSRNYISLEQPELETLPF